jgi:hypothetical protein
MQVKIHKNEVYGFVEYNESTKEFQVTHIDPGIVKTVSKYFESERYFNIDHFYIKAVQIQSLQFFQMAMCELLNSTEIHVYWG